MPLLNRDYRPSKTYQNKKPDSSASTRFLITSALVFIFVCVVIVVLFTTRSSTSTQATPSSLYYQAYDNFNYNQSQESLDDYAASLLQEPGSQGLGSAINSDITATTNISRTAAPNLQIMLPSRPVGAIQVSGAQFTDKNGTRFFMAGVNYEGHTDRAWKMWDADEFDANLIDSDFAMAAAGGYNTLRIFVRDSLRNDILANNFTKLDKVVDLAGKHGLRLLITFADYTEYDLGKLTAVESAVAKRYVASPAVLGYDLKNEPQFSDIVGAIYPANAIPPFQTDALIKAYGEHISQSDIASWRKGEGIYVVPGYMNASQAYFVANDYLIYQDFLNASDKWVVAHPNSTVADFIASPDAAKWQTFIVAMSNTLQAWIGTQQNAIRTAENSPFHKPITVGFNNLTLAALPANNALDFISVHRYANEGYDGLKATFSIMDSLHKHFGGKPVTLEEFGYSNSHGANSPVSLQVTAQDETAIWLYLYGKGFAGGCKWLLTNYPPGYNLQENNYGLLDDKTQPKPAYYATRAVMADSLINTNPEGDFNSFDKLPDSGLNYTFTSPNSIFSDAPTYSNNRVSFQQAGRDPWGIWWPSNGLGWIYFSTTGAGHLTLDLKNFFPDYAYDAKQPPTLRSSTNLNEPLDLNGDNVSLNLAANSFYILTVPSVASPFARAQPLGDPNSIYFNETGHNLATSFKTYWQQHGGLAMFGYPISEEFAENNRTVQYFERARLEYHPELAGTPNQVQLGLIGKEAAQTLGTKTQTVTAFTSSNTHLYFTQTGHSVANGFKAFWEQHGGVNQFGYPLTEEFTEVNPLDGKTYVVQYFERARFEYRADLKGTPQEIQLGLLGKELAKKQGWLA